MHLRIPALRELWTRFTPQPRKRETDRFERGPRYALVAVQLRDAPPAPFEQFEGLQASRTRIKQPHVGNPFTCVDIALEAYVDLSRRRRKHLTQSVWRKGVIGGAEISRHAFAPPTRQVRYKNVFAKVKFGIEDHPPAASTSASVSKCRRELPNERCTRN